MGTLNFQNCSHSLRGGLRKVPSRRWILLASDADGLGHPNDPEDQVSVVTEVKHKREFILT